MSSIEASNAARHARDADRFYGAFLVILALASAVAPLFAEATLAWTLFLAGLVGLSWLVLDRSPHGLLAAIGWALLAGALGYHLAFHELMDMSGLAATLGVGFVLLGAAEILFGLQRYRRVRPARLALMTGGAITVGFGIWAPLVWPGVQEWAASATVAAMFASFGVALLIGSRARRTEP
jgi:uncharacterized membrane protein HdeD (DUF308 family)